MKNWKYINGAEVGNEITSYEKAKKNDLEKRLKNQEQLLEDAKKMLSRKINDENRIGFEMQKEEAEKQVYKLKEEIRKIGNSKAGNSTWREPRRMPFGKTALKYAYDKAKAKGLSGRKLEDEMLRIAKTTPHDSAASESELRKDVSEWILDNGKPEDFVNNSKFGNVQFAGDYYDIIQENPEEFYIYLNGGARRYGPYRTKAAAEIELKKILDRRNRIGNALFPASKYDDEIHKLEMEYQNVSRSGGNPSEILKKVSEIEKRIQQLKELRRKETGNSDGVARMFEGLVKDENKEVEKDSGAIEELEKTGNTSINELQSFLDGYGTGGSLSTMLSMASRKFGDFSILNDRYLVDQKSGETYQLIKSTVQGKYVAKKIFNSKVGNADSTSLKPGDRVQSYGQKGTVKKVEEKFKDSIYGEPLVEVEFDNGTTKKIGEHYLIKVSNRSSWNSDRSIYAKWDEQKGRPSDEYARVTWMGQGKGGVVNIWKGQSMTSEKFGSLDRKELERWAEQRIGNASILPPEIEKKLLETQKNEKDFRLKAKKYHDEGNERDAKTYLGMAEQAKKQGEELMRNALSKVGNSKGNGIERAFKAMNKKDPEGLKKKIEDYAGQGLSYADVVSNLIRFGYDKADVEAQAEYIKKLTR